MRFSAGVHNREPAWLLAAAARPPTAVRQLLFDAESLTKRLQYLSGGTLRVVVLGQRWERPLASERRRLQLRVGQRALIRRVRLVCEGRPWVYARTVIPAPTLAGRWRRLAHLGERPLGALLFAQKSMRREPLEVARMVAGHRLYAEALEGGAPELTELWGRRSVFYVDNRALLVNELFLPALERRLAERVAGFAGYCTDEAVGTGQDGKDHRREGCEWDAPPPPVGGEAESEDVIFPCR